MICQRCGFCCIHYDVIIVSPDFIRETNGKFNVDQLNTNNLVHKPGGKRCPFLSFVEDKVHCKIHHFSWFQETPCAEFSQIENGNSPCRMGKFVRDNEDIYNKMIKPFKEEQYDADSRIKL